jgi:Subtilase family
LLHYGGNWVIRADGTLAVRDAGAGVISTVVTDTRMFHVGSGTSFAAPRVARAAADVLAAYPDASGNLVRALVALSAKVPQPVVDAFGDNVPRVAGHGLPRAARATASAGSRAVLMGEFSMATDTVAIHPLPIPRAFHDGRAARAIRVALAFDPPFRRTRREYLAGAMSFDLLRATGLDEVAAIYRKQDEDVPLSLPSGRRRMKLLPGSQTFDNSTLMVRNPNRRAAVRGRRRHLLLGGHTQQSSVGPPRRAALRRRGRAGGTRPPRRRSICPAFPARPATRAHPPPRGRRIKPSRLPTGAAWLHARQRRDPLALHSPLEILRLCCVVADDPCDGTAFDEASYRNKFMLGWLVGTGLDVIG